MHNPSYFLWKRSIQIEQLQDPSGATCNELHYNQVLWPDLTYYLHGWDQAVHVVASVAVVTEQQLVVILTGAAQGAGLALDALPGVLLDADQHVFSELETGGVAWGKVWLKSTLSQPLSYLISHTQHRQSAPRRSLSSCCCRRLPGRSHSSWMVRLEAGNVIIKNYKSLMKFSSNDVSDVNYNYIKNHAWTKTLKA